VIDYNDINSVVEKPTRIVILLTVYGWLTWKVLFS